MVPIGAWIVFGILFFGTIAFALAFVSAFTDPYQKSKMVRFASVFALAVVLVTLVLVPLDIYNVSSTRDADGAIILDQEEIEERNQVVSIVYYVLYGLCLFCTFVLIPFAYFAFEEEDDDASCKSICWAGCKYTSVLVLVVVVLLVIGFVLKPGAITINSDTNIDNFFKNLEDQQGIGEAAISFAVACLTLLGYVCLTIYGGFGLGHLPIRLIFGSRDFAAESSERKIMMNTNAEKLRALERKSEYNKLSRRDRKDLDRLRDSQRLLRSSTSAARAEAKPSCAARCGTCLRPFAVVFGILFALLSLFIITSLVLTQIDRLLHAACGSSCGYVLKSAKIFNPADALLVILSKFFPADYVLLLVIICYYLMATVAGMRRFGVRFLWIKISSVRWRKTTPQGMLLMCAMLMMSLLALNYQLVALAPQYTEYGSQVYVDNTTSALVPCSPNAPTDVMCTMSEIGTFVTTIAVKTPFFSTIYFWANWAMIAVFLIGFIFGCCRGRKSNFQASSDSSDVSV